MRFFCAEFDDRQTLVQLRQGLAGALGLVMQAGAETVRHLIEALVERPGKMHLGALRLFGKAAQRAREFGKAVFEIGGAAHGVDGLAAA